VATLAPSMDIQVPSNLERFDADPAVEFSASWSSDRQITQTIQEVRDAHGYEIDPHTATAWRAGDETRTDLPQLVVATAHPAKFDDSIAPPEWFPDLGDLPERVSTIGTTSSELDGFLR